MDITNVQTEFEIKFCKRIVTTREARWYIISVVTVCLSVCQTITFESLDMRHISRQ